jgi:hypothetical protein
MSNRNRRRKAQFQLQTATTIEQAYAQHVRQYPELHLPNISQGNANEQEVQTDVKCWLGGLVAGAQNRRILEEVTRLSRQSMQGLSGSGSLFSFISQPQTRGLFSVQPGQTQQPQQQRSNSIDEVMSTITREYRQAKQQRSSQAA